METDVGSFRIDLDLEKMEALRVAHETVVFAHWISDLMTAVLDCFRSIPGQSPLRRVDIEGIFSQHDCGAERCCNLEGIEVRFDVTIGDAPNLVEIAANQWALRHHDLISEIPEVRGWIARTTLQYDQPVMMEGVAFHLSVKEVPLPEINSNSEHAEAFMDFARRNDEASFKDLARMTLPNLSADDIEQMWVGTRRRIEKRK